MSMKKALPFHPGRFFAAAAVGAAIVGSFTTVTRATGGQSFTTLDSNYTQELVGTTQMPSDPTDPTTAIVLGGVAFAPDGDLWVADCVFSGTRLHRFDLSADPLSPINGTSTLHAETAVIPSPGGCGLVNWADPTQGLTSLFSNSSRGLYELNVSTGAPIRGPIGPPGNGLGIAVDPQTNHLVYAGADCHYLLIPDAPTCTLWDLDPAVPDGNPKMWAQVSHDAIPWIDGIYFDPTGNPPGNYLFVANRVHLGDINYLTIVRRPTAPVTHINDAQIVRSIRMTSEPDGVAFHDSSDPFVVTNDEYDPINGVGTMTRFDFPGGFEAPPAPATTRDSSLFPYETRFANGGFRGDLAQVGPDGCIYATQGRFFASADDGTGVISYGNGTRYDDTAETTEDSIVKICGVSGGFVPAQGVLDTVNGGGATLGSLGGLVFRDSNNNGVHDAGEPVLPGVSVTLSGDYPSSTVSGPDGTFTFSDLPAGDYTVSTPPTQQGLASSTPLSSTLTAGENKTDLQVAYEPGTISGTVFQDTNGNGVRDTDEPPLAGATVTLSGSASESTVTAPNGTYSFTDLAGGSYTVTVPSTGGAQTETLAPGGTASSIDFGYKLPASLGGTVFRDSNANGMRDAGEPPLAGVTVTLGLDGSGTAVSQPDGTYAFTNLSAGNYSVRAPDTASHLARSTTSPLTATLTAGSNKGGLDFGYKPGQLGGLVFRDSNGNGLPDGGEPPLAGVTLTLSGDASQTAISQPNGTYTFTNLDGGSYIVTAPATASGLALSTSSPLTTTLNAGATVSGLDFGYKPGSLAGTVFRDTNGNGARDAGEPALPGVTVTLGMGAGGTAVSQADGSYRFTDLAAGNYSLSVPLTASNLALSSPSPLTPTLTEGANRVGLDFGYKPGALSGYAYVDVNHNRTKDIGEPVLPGVVITGPGGTATTQADGSYSFNNLSAGGYSISAPTAVSVYTLETTSPLSVTVAAGQSSPNNNFGYVTATITGNLFLDTNGNTVRDAGEQPLGGVTVTLSGPVTATTTTDSNGNFTFTNLPPGTYTISVPQTTGGQVAETPSVTEVVYGGYTGAENFGFKPAAAYATYTQGGWGAGPAGNNPGMILKNNFAKVYPNGVTIGGSPYYLKFTSQPAIEAFLPAGGKPGVLNKSATNPTSSSANVFAGQVLALQLSVDFSKAGVITAGLAGQKLAPGNPLAGSTVTQVLTLANQVLAGNTSALPSGMSVSSLNDLLSRMNQNYDGGTTNGGILVP